METPEQAGAGAPEAETTAAPDPVLDRVAELATNFDGFRDDILGRLPEAQPEPEPPNPWDQLYDEPVADEPERQLNPDAFRRAVEAEAQRVIAPLMEQQQATQQALSQMQVQQDYSKLLTDHPELQDEEVRKATGDEVGRITARYPDEIARALANDPEFIATVHKARAAERSANGEVPAGGDPHQLEAAGSASPAGSEQQPNIVQQAIAQRRQLPQGLR